MAKYNYIVSGAGKDLWVGEDGNFECLVEWDRPTHYGGVTTLEAAREEQAGTLVNTNYPTVIYKFEAKPPYKYLGEVK